MILDYGTQLSPDPITLSIGTLKKPRLRDISRISFSTFNTYEVFLKCSPKEYYTKILENNGGIEKWNAISDSDKDTLTMYTLLKGDTQLQKIYAQLFNFFFEEQVVFREGFFILLDNVVEQSVEITSENIHGVISEDTFPQIIDIIQQICCIHSKADEKADDQNFKNDIARKLFEKMQKALKKQEEERKVKADKNLSLPNIISSVSSLHPSLNLLNIWDLTIFQLYDIFRRMQGNLIFDMNSTSVSVWGDEKNKFDQTLWHKNYYD